MSSKQNQMDYEIENILTPEDYVAIYARKSNPRFSHSIETQVDLGLKKLEELGLVLYKVYSDEKSASERAKGQRDEFEQLKIDIKLGKFKNLIVFKRDRLSRKLDELLELRRFFRKHNVNVYYSDENEYSSSKDDYYSNFIENIVMAISKWEPDKINDRISIGKQAKWERREYAHGIHVPLGYKAIMQEGSVTKYVHDQPKAELIKNLVATYVSPNNETELKKIMKQIVKAEGNNDPSYYIKNPVYAGLRWKKSTDISAVFKKDKDTDQYYIPDKNKLKEYTNVTPIIDKELWYEAITLWRNGHTPRDYVRHTYLFKDLVYCNYCKKKLSIQSSYYRCLDENCKKTSATVDNLEETLLKRVLKELLNDSFVSKYTSNLEESIKTSISKDERELVKVDKEIQKELMKYTKHLDYNFLTEETKEKLIKSKSIQSSLSTNQYRLYNLKYLRENIEKLRVESTINKIAEYFIANKDMAQIHMRKLVYRCYVSGKRKDFVIKGVDYVGI